VVVAVVVMYKRDREIERDKYREIESSREQG
jgi:hypothetical protein